LTQVIIFEGLVKQVAVETERRSTWAIGDRVVSSLKVYVYSNQPMSPNPLSGSETENNDNADESRVNYWLNYLSDISEEEPGSDSNSLENVPTQSPPSQDSTGLGGLGEILLGNTGGGSNNANEFDLLQEILVKPEMIEFRERIGNLEQKYDRIENRNDAQKIAEVFLPLMSKLLNRKLAKLKNEIVGELTPLLERLVEEQYDREKNLSIRVVGIQKDANSIE
jgi:hypothetical protein